jgi:hypothetical protein
MNLCFDTEFTHLKYPGLPAHAHLPPAQLISIGIAGMRGERFYAENSQVDHSLCSQFVLEEVLPHLEGGAVSMPSVAIAEQLKDWLEALQEPVKLWTDCPAIDWPFVVELFEQTSWPANLEHECGDLNFRGMVQLHQFKRAKVLAMHGQYIRCARITHWTMLSPWWQAMSLPGQLQYKTDEARLP